MYLLIGQYEKSSKKSYVLFFIILIAVYFSTFRDGMGADYTAYKNFCESDMSKFGNWFLLEPFPMLIYNYCFYSKFSAIVFFFITSALTCVFSFWVYSRFKNFWISAFVFITYTNLYLSSFNLVRQYVASSIILLGTYLFVIKKKSPMFFLFILFAFLWHKSAIICVFIYFLRTDKVNSVIWIAVIILSWILPFNFITSTPFLGQVLELFEYSDYLTHNTVSYSRTSIVNLYMHVMVLFLLIKSKHYHKKQFDGKNIFNLALKLTIISIVFSNISANSLPFAYRFAMFFSPFIPILFSYLPSMSDKNISFVLVIIPIFILLMTVFALHIDDRIFCPQRILPIESIYDDKYKPYENPDYLIAN